MWYDVVVPWVKRGEWRLMLLNCCWLIYVDIVTGFHNTLIVAHCSLIFWTTHCLGWGRYSHMNASKSRRLNKWSPHSCKNRLKAPCTAHNLRGLCEARTLPSGTPQSQATNVKPWQQSQYTQKGLYYWMVGKLKVAPTRSPWGIWIPQTLRL